MTTEDVKIPPALVAWAKAEGLICKDCGNGVRLCRCIPTTCPDCKQENQPDQFCRWCQQHFGPNTNRP